AGSVKRTVRSPRDGFGVNGASESTSVPGRTPSPFTGSRKYCDRIFVVAVFKPVWFQRYGRPEKNAKRPPFARSPAPPARRRTTPTPRCGENPLVVL